MVSKEARIRDRAYAIWQQQGGVHGQDEKHWLQAERELGENEPEMSADTAEAETAGLAPEAPQSGTENQDLPPARSGSAAQDENLVEGKTGRPQGRVPVDPLSK